MSGDYTAKWGPKAERPCKYVYGELIPLTDAQMEERDAIMNAPTFSCSGSGVGGNRSFKDPLRLDKRERECLFTQTGQHFDSPSEYRRWCKASGRRSVEGGEPQDVTRREMQAWHEGGEQGPPPHSPGQWKRRAAEERIERAKDEVKRELHAMGQLEQ